MVSQSVKSTYQNFDFENLRILFFLALLQSSVRSSGVL